MYTLKGFFTFASLIDNADRQIARFGELSAHGSTYAKDRTFHSDSNAPGTTLVSFHSVRDNSTVDVPVEVVSTTISLGTWLLDRAMDGLTSNNSANIIQAVNAEFAGIVVDFKIGEMATDGNVYLPEWLSFRHAGLEEDNDVRVWLSDEAFRNQYSEFVIEVIPPFGDLDAFFQDPLRVKERLDAYNIVDKLQEVQTVRDDYPYTLQKAMSYDYRDPNDDTFRLPTYWVVLIYGQAGNNPDLIKNTIIDYVLENSTHTREEWAEILPDLFITTEFIFTPFWNEYSVPNLELHAGIYSPTINPREALELVRQYTRGTMYTTTWVNQNYELSTNIYKSLAFGVVGNPDNIDGRTSFRDHFADYMLVTNSSSDYNRISVRTQEFMARFNQLIQTAEHFTRNSSVPSGLARVIRDDVLYITTTFENITYLVVAKSNMDAPLALA